LYYRAEPKEEEIAVHIATLVVIGGCQFLIGCVAGYIAYMTGIQGSDIFLLLDWFLLLPAAGFALSLRVGRREDDKVYSFVIVCTTLSAFVVLYGFNSTYRYPIWNHGFWYALSAGGVNCLLCIVGRSVGRRCKKIVMRLSSIFLAGYVLLCVSWAGVASCCPIEYKQYNSLSYAGEGILNIATDDNQIVVEDGKLLKTAFFDGCEVPGLNPAIMRQLYGMGVRPDFSRGYRLRGRLLVFLGLGGERCNEAGATDQP